MKENRLAYSCQRFPALGYIWRQKDMRRLCFLLLVGYLTYGLHAQSVSAIQRDVPSVSDPKWDKRARNVYENLFFNREHILFGHEDALAYGVKWKQAENRSDVKDVAGAHPAVFGWELSQIDRSPHNIDTVRFDDMRHWMRQAYRMGGINTINWHMENPVSGGNAWDQTPAVAAILPGGEKHEAYLKKLDILAEYLGSIKAGFLFQHRIPIIFRPFHEMSGSWFWWGSDHCTPAEYKALWQFTVDYLRKEKGLHHLLIAYSPDVVSDRETYLRYYPGDEYVDILGLDIYFHDNPSRRDPLLWKGLLRMVVNEASSRGKVAALTETGYESIPEANWWTDFLLRSLKSDPAFQRLAYVLVWRNHRPSHHYAPFMGHSSAGNFRTFCADDLIWLQSDLPKLYRRK